MRTYKVKKCSRVQGLYFAPDGERLFVVGGSSEWSIECAVWLDLNTGEELGRIEIDFADTWAVDPDLTRLVAGGWDYDDGASPLRWLSLTGKNKDDWHAIDAGGVGHIYGLAFDASGTRLAVTSETELPRRKGESFSRERCAVDIYRFPKNKPPTKISSGTTAYNTNTVAFNADATRLAVGAGQRGVNSYDVFDVKTGWRVFDFDPEAEEKRAVLFLPDGRFLASAGSYVYVFPPTGGDPQFVLGEGKARVNALAHTPDGAELLAARNNGVVRVWDTATGKARKTLAWRVGGVWTVSVSPDGLRGAAAGSKGQIVVWDLE